VVCCADRSCRQGGRLCRGADPRGGALNEALKPGSTVRELVGEEARCVLFHSRPCSTWRLAHGGEADVICIMHKVEPGWPGRAYLFTCAFEHVGVMRVECKKVQLEFQGFLGGVERQCKF
jgi:hypothetical protein